MLYSSSSSMFHSVWKGAFFGAGSSNDTWKFGCIRAFAGSFSQ